MRSQLIEARLTDNCAACGRRMPSWALEGEGRHVGGHSLDVVYWYCKAGYGHRENEGRQEDDSIEARTFEWVDGTHQQA